MIDALITYKYTHAEWHIIEMVRYCYMAVKWLIVVDIYIATCKLQENCNV